MAPRDSLRPATLFDLYCRADGMVLWLIEPGGARVRVIDRQWRPSCFVGGPARELAAMERTLARWEAEVEVLGPTTRRDFWTGDARPVLELRIRRPFEWSAALERLYRLHPDIDYYNADLLPEQQYCFDHGLVPCGGCAYEESKPGVLAAIERRDDEWEPAYALPPLAVAELRGGGTLWGGRPRLDWLGVRIDGREERWEGGDPAEVVAGLDSWMARHDPDVVLSDGGDHFLVPLLLMLASQARNADGDPIALRLDRDTPPRPRLPGRSGRSFFSYGRVLYQAPDYPFYGRWHLDRRNSFMIDHTGFDGLVEVCRVSKLPIQRVGRRSIGTGITSIQLDFAYREGFLIPWKKSHPEAWKSASQLLRSDRGGLVYQPLVGAYEGVVEIDFVSMYPTIMSRFNVSPETVNCRCCRNDGVPELGYTLCEKRRGLVARSLEPIIAKRVALKRLRKSAKAAGDAEAYTRFDSRQSALKWLLVCCFGYLGYRNARFGRIEAHESVCAFARDRLMTAREVCERHHLRVLHMIVDCFWFDRSPEFAHLGPPTAEEVDTVCAEIGAATGLDIAVEGRYRWIAFLPSRQHAEMPVPNRFFGAFEDGTLKFRGVEARRHDLPPYVRSVQERALGLLAAATDLAGYRARVPDLISMLRDAEAALWRGEVPREELLITRHLSMAPEEYRSNGMIALAARQALAAGLPISAGQSVSYLIVRQHDRDPLQRVCIAPLLQPETTYDPGAYARLLRRGFQTLLLPVGIDLSEDPEPPPAPARRAPSPRPPRWRTEQTDLFSCG